ncbi:sigma-70 family RNA polymerase sigma factor [Streptomyces griseoviridis]|uniref:RNA polymerase sigma-70 factor (ECF subfamily) n=3 Tax=Streptomyces TaxID=1883 RepID=A0ABT9LQQ2_STRGD|nr:MULTISPECIES: sigma-70 family RNA polymerase sigma factor [Streptomyces]MDP9685854.1 RNA polymerase sigma-70 factor (ECF subfamily) [Streptomyces griseoviridis]GGS43201.1 RNA polymerase sigma factor [Streptomyces niveoruber]GGS77662.1 RNA polymerase sigma factor [Streptomyces griseoviridis]GGU15039.1 RNA polymerase sigma factor [Streptomyces daghestanicus]GHI35141.1 RNA polymerase sigma factor [Streptomyces daghestanicus]
MSAADGPERLADRFEEHRGRLRAVAYRMLGSLPEAEDAVQEAWLRLHRTGADGIDNLGGWLTTVTGRICLDLLRSRAARREEPMSEDPGAFVPDPLLAPLPSGDPEREALHADSVGLALLVVLRTLEPAERLAFVLHDMFAVPFDAIAPVVERTPAATRQLASRARRRVRAATPVADPDLGRQRAALDAFLAASRAGDFEALVAVLHPDVVLRADAGGPLSRLVRGARTVGEQAMLFRQDAVRVQPVLVNGTAGVVARRGGRPLSVLTATVADGRITELYILADPDRLSRLALPAA